MSKFQQHSLSQNKFLTVAGNVLFKSILESQRTVAKNLFNSAREGKRVALLKVQMEDGSDLRFDITLDHSEYRGNLNFGAFRDSVSHLVANLSQSLGQGKDLPVFTEETDGSMLFGVTGPTVEGDQVNVMMMAADLASAGTVLLKLQYMDPQQFVEAEKEQTA